MASAHCHFASDVGTHGLSRFLSSECKGKQKGQKRQKIPGFLPFLPFLPFLFLSSLRLLGPRRICGVTLLTHSFTDFNLQITANALVFPLDIALATSLDPNEK